MNSYPPALDSSIYRDSRCACRAEKMPRGIRRAKGAAACRRPRERVRRLSCPIRIEPGQSVCPATIELYTRTRPSAEAVNATVERCRRVPDPIDDRCGFTGQTFAIKPLRDQHTVADVQQRRGMIRLRRHVIRHSTTFAAEAACTTKISSAAGRPAFTAGRRAVALPIPALRLMTVRQARQSAPVPGFAHRVRCRKGYPSCRH